MRILSVTLLLVAVSAAQDAARSANPEEEDQAENSSPEETTRDKRGFIITPLSALPAAIVAQLEPYLRALVPPPILNQVAGLLPSAALEVAPQELPALLSATAPLTLNRAVTAQAAGLPDPRTTQAALQPSGIANPRLVGRLVVNSASNIPPAPPVVPTPAVLARIAATSALRNGFLLSPTIPQGVSVVGRQLVVNPTLSTLPQASPLIPTPSVSSTARLALPTTSIFANSRLTAPFIVAGTPKAALVSPSVPLLPNYPYSPSLPNYPFAQSLPLTINPVSVPQQLVLQNQQSFIAVR